MAKAGGGAGGAGGAGGGAGSAGGAGGGGPTSKIAIGGRTTTLRTFTRKDIPKASSALSTYERGHKLSVKSRSRVQEARWKLNGVRSKLGRPGQAKAVRNAAKVVARVEKSGAAGVVFRDIYYEK